MRSFEGSEPSNFQKIRMYSRKGMLQEHFGAPAQHHSVHLRWVTPENWIGCVCGCLTSLSHSVCGQEGPACRDLHFVLKPQTCFLPRALCDHWHWGRLFLSSTINVLSDLVIPRTEWLIRMHHFKILDCQAIPSSRRETHTQQLPSQKFWTCGK